MHAAGAKAADAVPEPERHVHGKAPREARPGEVRNSGTRSVRLPARTLSPPAPLPKGQAELRIFRFRHLELALFDHSADLVSSIAQRSKTTSWGAQAEAALGPRKLRAALQRTNPKAELPSVTTFALIFKRNASRALAGLSELSAWWLKIGIRRERIEPGKPQRTAAMSA